MTHSEEVSQAIAIIAALIVVGLPVLVFCIWLTAYLVKGFFEVAWGLTGGLLWELVRLSTPTFLHGLKRVVKWVFRIAGVAATDAIVEHLVAEHCRLRAEQQAIDRAMRANPGDPALLGRIEALTAEVEGFDRLVLQRLNQQVRRAFGHDD